MAVPVVLEGCLYCWSRVTWLMCTVCADQERAHCRRQRWWGVALPLGRKESVSKSIALLLREENYLNREKWFPCSWLILVIHYQCLSYRPGTLKGHVGIRAHRLFPNISPCSTFAVARGVNVTILVNLCLWFLSIKVSKKPSSIYHDQIFIQGQISRHTPSLWGCISSLSERRTC